jgi:coenzyme PQQ synthesis protein D (PqqD)
MRLVANKPTVISETIQGETIIIHLGTGTYYSLEGSGADVWSALESSATAREIAERLEAQYEVEGDVALSAVESVLTDLSTEELVREANGEPVSAAEPAAPVAERQEFMPPKLAKYTDMQDIILLDPVHEVDERGWPYARA